MKVKISSDAGESSDPHHTPTPPEPWGITLAERQRDRRRKLRVSAEIHDGQVLLVVTAWRRHGPAGWWPNPRQTVALSPGDFDAVQAGITAIQRLRRLPEAKS